MFMLRELRKAKGLTMKELGQIVGVAESTISQYETEKREPDFETILKFGEIFDVSVDYLLRGSVYGGDQIKNAPSQEAEGIQLTEVELDTILRYRSAPVEIQKAVDRVLEVDEPPE